MFNLSSRLLFATGIAIAMSPGAASAGPPSQEVIEARQETRISTTYALSPYLRTSDLSVSVRGGRATLTGSVEESANKELAEQIALSVDGIEHVDNRIAIEVDYSVPVPTADRPFGEVIDDAFITADVISKLAWSNPAQGLATKVVTRRGKVTLTGTADSTVQKGRAGRLALDTQGVKSVDNQLVVKRALPSSARLD